MSSTLWQSIVIGLDGSIQPLQDGTTLVEVGVGKLFYLLLAISMIAALLGGWLISLRRGESFGSSFSRWVLAGWWWWMIPGAWEIARVTSLILGWESLFGLLVSVAFFLFCIAAAGWAATFMGQFCEKSLDKSSSLPNPKKGQGVFIVWGMIAIYTIIFTAMNWQLYNGLLVPHGDSVMYEEHLWNITHGKGFRSYLDQGLFWGEHIQFVHLLLLPVYLLFSSHFTLELFESFALAIAALPVFWIAKRQTQSPFLAVLMAATYLFYMPMHYLDISIDLKTFRPISFGIPFILFGIDQYERRRFAGMIVCFLLALSAKEEFAIIIATFGVWVFFDRPVTLSHSVENIPSSTQTSFTKQQRILGSCLAIAGTLYLLFAVGVAIPWFRDGLKVHYSAYFGDLGHSPSELVKNSFRNPILFAKMLFTTRTVYYFLALFVPLGFLPLFSLKRVAVMLPLFIILSLMTINHSGKDILIPIHHFHAPLIPILLWAACAGLANVKKNITSITNKMKSLSFLNNLSLQWAGWFAICSAIFVGLFMGFGPNSIGFWESGSSTYWRSRYVPGKRAEMFAEVIKQIPPESNVASTDFVHPRFTHYRRSYDYSDFLRKVSNYEKRVPDDTDYIVIDTRHPYSKIQKPEQLRELKKHSDKWEVLPDKTEGYYIILKRIRKKKSEQ